VAKHNPEVGSISAELDLAERLRLFHFTDEDLAVARKIWSIMEPEAPAICAIQLEQWRSSLGEHVNFERRSGERALESRLADLRNRYTRLDELDWVQSAERIVAIAFAADVSLTKILSMDSAGAAKTLEILSLRYDCSKEERQQINDVFFRMRSLECDIYSTLCSAITSPTIFGKASGRLSRLQPKRAARSRSKPCTAPIRPATCSARSRKSQRPPSNRPSPCAMLHRAPPG
jgi:methyl-accepting chemotaxis protein